MSSLRATTIPPPPLFPKATIQGKIAEWWEQAAGAEEEDPRPKEATAPPKAERGPPPEKKKPSSSKSSSKASSGSSDKEMMDFRHLMVKGLELKKSTGDGASEKCVIYMDVTCRTLFCAAQKNAANAKAHRVEDITEASASKGNEKIISIGHKEGTLDLEVSSPKVRDYLVRMLNKLFTGEKNKAAEKDEGGGSKSKPKSSSRDKPGGRSSKPSKSSSSSSRDAPSSSSRSGRNQVSQVWQASKQASTAVLQHMAWMMCLTESKKGQRQRPTHHNHKSFIVCPTSTHLRPRDKQKMNSLPNHETHPTI
jgi:hypothetical protein